MTMTICTPEHKHTQFLRCICTNKSKLLYWQKYLLIMKYTQFW